MIHLLGFILALIDFGFTRRSSREHPDPATTPEVIANGRRWVLSSMAEAAAADAIPFAREQIQRWATLIEAGLEEPHELFRIARDCIAALPKPAAARLRALVTEAPPACTWECPCLCGHPCGGHRMRGGACYAEGCRCQSFMPQAGRRDMMAIFAEVDALLRAGAPPEPAAPAAPSETTMLPPAPDRCSTLPPSSRPTAPDQAPTDVAATHAIQRTAYALEAETRRGVP